MRPSYLCRVTCPARRMFVVLTPLQAHNSMQKMYKTKISVTVPQRKNICVPDFGWKSQ